MVNRAKPSQKLFIFSIFSAHISLVYSTFNFEELHDVKYGFEISKEPVLLSESSAVGNTVLLSSKHGQQYQCILPDLSIFEKANEENRISSNEEIPLLLDPLKKKCLYNHKGWWTYEVCFGKGIYQYHEEDNKIVGDKISLGFFNNETDWSQGKEERVRSKAGKSNTDKKFHSQYYVNGSECDLNGKARETQIKIFCEEGSSDLVYRVDEPSSCSYVVTVYTSKLCNHWLFKPGSSQSYQPITCSPALSEERYKIYIESTEMKKKAKAEARTEKLRPKKARGEAVEYDDEDGVEEDEDEQDAFAREKKKKRSKRSPLWPWEDPGVESEDQVLIDGQIKDDQIDVSRLDVMKGGKKNAAGQNLEESLTITSSKMRRMREERKKVESKLQEQHQSIDDLGEEEEGEDTNQERQNSLSDEESEGADHSDHEKESENTDKVKETPPGSGELTSETSDDNGKETEKEPDLSAEDWEKKFLESFQKLRSTFNKKLGQLETKSPDLDHNTNEEPVGAAGEVPDNNVEPKSAESAAEKATDEQDAVPEGVPHDDESLKEEAQKAENTMKQFPFLKSIPGLAKVLNNKLLKEILDTATDSQAEIEKQFNEQRARMKRTVEGMREKIREIEDAETKSGVKNEQLTETMDKMKASIDRFEKVNTELDVDMQSVKELHSEILNSLTKKIKPDELLERSSKAGKLFKTIVARRILLEEEAQHIREMSEKIAEREGLNMETDAPKDTGIDAVINKLKTLVHDLDSREDKTRSTDDAAKASDTSTSVDVEKENDPNTKAGELGDPRGMSTGVKVRVSRIKKVVTDDEEDGDVDGEIAEKDLEAHELEELKMNRRIKQATKKMEEMVKQQLRDSGVVPSGKIKVKIVTSKEALENLDIDNDKDVKLLSEKEETQFRDMILNLLGGTPEAGKEKRRQQDLESNYNLVWNDDKLQEVPREDDTDGEVEVESF